GTQNAFQRLTLGKCRGEMGWKHTNDTRTVYIANKFPQHGHYIPQRFADNRIISSKYTIWNFIPKNLFEQFRRIANFYFLIIFLVQLMIDTPTSPITSGLPLFFVITVTAIKQGYEDWLRHKADNEVNGAPVFVVRSGSLVQTRSKNIRVGDIVRVAKDETFPADLVLLSSDRAEGTCHITTASLDGETNLKTHYAVPETAVSQSVSRLESLQAVVECQQPEADLYRYHSQSDHRNPPHTVGLIPLGSENLLLRGARLKNTKEIFGVAVYTGMESKMALNYKCKSQKRSAVEKSMNTFLIIYLGILLFEAILSTILKYAWQAENKWDEPFYNQKTDQERNSSQILKFISDFLAFLVLYNFIIPISLYVTVELQKFLGSFFIGWDLDLYHEESDQKAQVNTSDLNEELGQVEYVFTDKTGTLTENEMQFRECSINGIKYQEINGKLVPEGMTEDSPDGSVPCLNGEEELFLKAVSLCHTVQISYDQTDGPGDPFSHANGFSPLMEYYASSPDEKALVERYLMTFCLSLGEKVLFTKGAESAVLPYTTSGEIDKTRVHVDEFALVIVCVCVCVCVCVRVFVSRLQDKVQETIESLRLAGIKVWVLTGDKHETAVSVSLSCGHFHRTMNILELVQQKSDSECAEQLRRLARRCTCTVLHGCDVCLCLCRIKEDHVIQHGLVVDGASLSLALREHEKLFMEVCKNCSAVLCCRMAPLQKAKVVRLLKTSPEKPITLAIGDGANDVSMIQEAHVGIGRCRIGEDVACNSNAYWYTVCLSSWCIHMFCRANQHFTGTASGEELKDISKNSLLSFKTFLYWTFLGFCHAFVFFFGSYILMGEDTTLMGNGQMFGNWTFGTLVFTVMVITVTLKLALETHFWTWMNHFVTWGSIAFYFIFSLFYGGIIWPFLHTQDMYFVFVQLLSSGSAWFAIIIIIITCLFPDVIKKVFYRHLQPTSTQKSQVSVRLPPQTLEL
uniref:Probable phospholipid-transporting ATPase IF n=1 Tax=Sinocyclocheilus anshuiensis TaxID=1608454 RepID=A0A671SRG6_9TELE